MIFLRLLELHRENQRRIQVELVDSLVEDYYASLNWESMESIRKFVKVLENTLLISWIGHEGKQRLRSLCEKHGFAVDKDGYRIYLTTLGVGNNVKNLIFAASGPKPEIIFSDSVSNDIEIVKNADYCLIYDRPIKSHGLLWKELVDWWREREQLNEESDIESAENYMFVCGNHWILTRRSYFGKFILRSFMSYSQRNFLL
jgi:hypothetical protein